MISNLRKTDPLISTFNGALIDMPAPLNLSAWWNFGSLLGLCLGVQIVSGLMVATHYLNSLDLAFSSVVSICRDVNYGWGMRTIHANGASLFFICLYAHTGRGIYYGSFRFLHTWSVGVTILFLTMATAFLGYVLPWGQMSFWGATVITNLLSTVPYAGQTLVMWLWGGFAVEGATLTRFFTFHFTLPFVIAALVGIHIMYLHQTGSNNPLGVASHQDKVPFHQYFTYKDMVGFVVLLVSGFLVVLWDPYLLGDPENFNPANPLSTPPHIQPEWYYLFAYAILRSIPNKLGGVIALVLSIALLYALPALAPGAHRPLAFYPLGRILFWSYVASAVLLTWIGARPVEPPYVVVGQILTIIYFSFFVLFPLVSLSWDKMSR